MKLLPLWTLFLLMTIAVACNNPDANGNGTDTGNGTPVTPLLNYSVVKIHPHDTTSFVEGLEFHDGTLFEGTGSPAEFDYPSWLGKIDLNTGKLQHLVTLDTQYFGEGITIFNGKLYQLTWTSKKCFVYDVKTLKKVQELTYNTEGWGMTHDSTAIIMGDGSSNLYYMDPATFRNTKILGVTDNNGPVSNLNELEYIDGFIYANLWQTPYIVKIDPASGKVVAKMNMDSMVYEVDNKYKGHDYLNGIAYNPATKTIFITGKRWPSMYEIKF
ncbi:MAG: glutaminyl-peptide cyclotransferase [Chitinophagaceae bacterium]